MVPPSCGRGTRGKILMAVIGLYVLFILLAGCGQPPQATTPDPFEQFCGLASDRFASIDEKELRQWIRTEFSDMPLKRFDNWIKAVVYSWDKGEAFLFDGHLAALDVKVEAGKEVTLGQVVERLGPPKAISTWTVRINHSTRYAILLDYSEQGLQILGHMEVQPDTILVGLTEDIRVDGVLCFVPGSTEALKRLDRGYDPELRSWTAWPGFGALMPIDKP